MRRGLQAAPAQSVLLEEGSRTQKPAPILIIEMELSNLRLSMNYRIVLARRRGLLYADSLLTRVGSHVYLISRTS